jgi:hypothetical protein
MGANRTMKKPYLAVYDYGQGGVWAVIYARTKEGILRKYPALQVFDARPAWMTEHEFETYRSNRSCDIDDEPSGWFAMLKNYPG